MKNNATKDRKSSYNPARSCYLTADGRYYCYEYLDPDTNRTVTQKLEVGKDLSVELTLILDELDHGADLTDRYESELRDALFDARVAAVQDNEKAIDPWSTLADEASMPETILFAEGKPDSPIVAQVRRVIEADCTPAQQEFFFEHFGCQTQLEEMRQAEVEQTGKLPSSAAMTNRKNKIIDKVAKSLGAERVKRHRYPTKG